MEKSTESEGFQNFLEEHGADVLRFCIILTENRERGNDLYQDTMLSGRMRRRSMPSTGAWLRKRVWKACGKQPERT